MEKWIKNRLYSVSDNLNINEIRKTNKLYTETREGKVRMYKGRDNIHESNFPKVLLVWDSSTKIRTLIVPEINILSLMKSWLNLAVPRTNIWSYEPVEADLEKQPTLGPLTALAATTNSHRRGH